MKKKLKKRVIKSLTKLVTRATGLLSQDENERSGKESFLPEGLAKTARQAAAEGAVLLKNNGALPLKNGSVISVFGRVQVDYFAVGYGSGGDVNAVYTVNLLEALISSPEIKVNDKLAKIYLDWIEKNEADHGFWGHWPRFLPEMPLDEKIVREAAENSDSAVIVIGRAAGEDRENLLKEGSYYLTAAEKDMIKKVAAAFDKVTVVLDSGNMMDISWVDSYNGKISAVLFAWQGGMESGNAVADVLTGRVNPCGKLTSAVAREYKDYPSSKNFGGRLFNNYTEDIFVGYRYFETFEPEKVIYPFGFGLSYTDFSIEIGQFSAENAKISLKITIKNIGETAGKEVVQVYFAAPQAELGKAAKSLIAFAKTDIIQAGETQNLNIEFPIDDMASFDESGITGFELSYVLEKGEYGIYVGQNVRNAKKAGAYYHEETSCVKKLSSVMPLKEENLFERMVAKTDAGGRIIMRYEKIPYMPRDLKQRINENMPTDIEFTGDKGIKLTDVKSKKASLDDFVAQLSLEELEALSRGDYKMGSRLGTPGNAGVFGGVLPSLRDKGIPPVSTTDGPSGLRLHTTAALLPCGTLLASTWDIALIEKLFEKVGEEMQAKGSDVILAPGLNIHRDPLCGRNFEYFSEDPLVSGKIAAAVVRGIQSKGVSACPKHFACNNQETNRIYNDSRVSQRALREIYFKGFEICIRESNPQNIMTSYNKINGVWSYYNYDLCTTILRGEWAYEGNVMTDWWMRSSKDPDFPKLCDNAYRIRSQVDLFMPGGKMIGKSKPDGTLLASYGKRDGIKLGELQRSAKNILNFVMLSRPF